jgi:phosphonate transport system substrate-binding protein
MCLDPPPVELLAAPVLEGERYLDRPIYFSDVIVASDSPARSIADLRGASWSFNDPDSHSGYGVVLYHLASLGETPRFFSSVTEAGSHHRSIRLVADGKVAASAIDSQVLAVELREHPELRKRVRVIASLGPSPIQPLVAARRLPQSLRSSVAKAVIDMHRVPEAQQALAYGFVKHWDPVADSDYDPIRHMLEVVDRAGLSFVPA